MIGLEIHAQIKTKSKMFSSDSAEFSSKENQCIHPVSLGFPGTLPQLNQQVIKSALKAGQAFSCQVQKKSIFSRKNYFYPDLPKGYQISQLSLPLLKKGYVEFYLQKKPHKIHIERIHLEEDAGRLLHKNNYSLVDFNRAGMPLLEIVSYPEISSPECAAEYARMVRNILLYLDICDGNLQEGSMRFDCNISLKKPESSKLGTRVELKNLNSFRFIEKALDFEIRRQTNLLDNKNPIHQETRLFDPKKNETFAMRSKESSSDYRYFPEPDLPPLIITPPSKPLEEELPFQKTNRLSSEYKLPLESCFILIEDINLCTYFEKAAKHTSHQTVLCNWIINDLSAKIKETKISSEKIPILPKEMAQLSTLIKNKTLSSKMAKEVFSKMWSTKKPLQTLIRELGLKKLDNADDLLKIINQVIKEFPEQCQQYRSGKITVYKFLMGQVMKISKGQADPVKTNNLMKKRLEKLSD